MSQEMRAAQRRLHGRGYRGAGGGPARLAAGCDASTLDGTLCMRPFCPGCRQASGAFTNKLTSYPSSMPDRPTVAAWQTPPAVVICTIMITTS